MQWDSQYGDGYFRAQIGRPQEYTALFALKCAKLDKGLFRRLFDRGLRSSLLVSKGVDV